MREFELDSLTEYSDQAILGEIQRVAALHAEGPLTKTAFVKLSPKDSSSTVEKRFGGWKKALLAAGLTHLSVENHMPYREKMHHGHNMSNDELVNEMLRVHSSIGGDVLTAKGFDRVSVTHSNLIRKRFGDWKSALTKAGIAQSSSNTANPVQPLRGEADCRDVRPGLSSESS